MVLGATGVVADAEKYREERREVKKNSQGAKGIQNETIWKNRAGGEGEFEG